MKHLFYIIISLFYTISLFAFDNNLFTTNTCIFPIINEDDTIKIFINGDIYINADEKVDNLLVINGVVSDYNVKLEEYPQAEIINLKGKAAYPGFNDSHVHLLETSPFIVLGINMNKCLNSRDIADSLAAHIGNIKEGEIMIGVGFSLDNYDAWSVEDLKLIDSITGNRLVFLGDKLGHNVIVNTATLNFCNITTETEVPMGGIIGGKDKGQLNGMLRESAMTLAGNKFFTLIDKNLIKNASLNMFRYWASFGYTGIVDLMGSAAGRMIYPEIAMELEQEGKLPLRVYYCYTFFNLEEIDSAVKYKDINSEMVRFNGCKLFVDGAYAAGQAWTSWRNELGNYGLFYVYPNDSFKIKYNLNRIVEKLEEKGLNCHYHIQGDQGIENLLNALDSVVAKKGKLSCLHTIIHSAFITKSQIERINKFNGSVVMTMQPGFWEVEDNLEKYYGNHFYESYPVKEIIDEGITVGISTDFTVSPINYCPASKVIGVAVTGGDKPEHHKPLTIRDMINGLSYGSYATTPSKDLGKLEKGYKADIVVFEKDLYSISADTFSAIYPKVKSIWIGGRKTFEIPDTITNVEEIDYNSFDFNLYPNPASNYISISTSRKNNIEEIVIHNLFGIEIKRIDEKELYGRSSISVSTKDLPSGIYYCTLSTEKGKFSKSFVVIR